jgi:hypothetical protein
MNHNGLMQCSAVFVECVVLYVVGTAFNGFDENNDNVWSELLRFRCTLKTESDFSDFKISHMIS